MLLIRCVSCRTGLASFRRLDPDLQRTLSVPPHTYEDQACANPTLPGAYLGVPRFPTPHHEWSRMILIRCVSCRTGLASFRRLDPDLQRPLGPPPHTYEDHRHAQTRPSRAHT